MADLFRRLCTAIAISGFLTGAAAAQGAAPCPAGYDALDANDPEGAIPAFETCLSRQLYAWPVEVELRARLGAAHLALGEGDAALLAYNQAFALIQGNGGNTDSPLIRRNRAAAYLQTGDYEAALSDIERALASQPDDAFTRLLQGSALLDLDRPEEAVAAFDAAVRSEPDYASAWIGRSAAFVEMELTANGVSDAEEAVALAPQDAGALNALCWALVQDGRAADGLDICDAAVAADPASGAIVHSRAAALEQVGRVEEAATLYARAHDLAPDDPEITADHERVNGS
jgi:tetratricopeptide (TPR) repeat protein